MTLETRLYSSVHSLDTGAAEGSVPHVTYEIHKVTELRISVPDTGRTRVANTALRLLCARSDDPLSVGDNRTPPKSVLTSTDMERWGHTRTQ